MLRVVGRAAAIAVALMCAACATSAPPEIALGGEQPALVTADTPQGCAVYAREHSRVAIYGDAYTWWDQAAGRYARSNQPTQGAIMVLAGYAGPKHGHLAVVTKIVSEHEIRVDHANWLNDGNIYLNTPVIDVSSANDWSEVRVWNTRDGHLGANTYTVQGFILPAAETTTASAGD